MLEPLYTKFSSLNNSFVHSKHYYININKLEQDKLSLIDSTRHVDECKHTKIIYSSRGAVV